MAGGKGTVVLDFGDANGYATAAVSGVTGLTASANVELYFEGSTLGSNDADGHALAASLCRPVASAIGTETFTAIAIDPTSSLTGAYTAQFVWHSA
ncbi:MAG: hypothetical protein ACRC4O_11885 [Giesbergeria sp.]